MEIRPINFSSACDFINNKGEKTHGFNREDDSPMLGEEHAKRH